MCVCLCVCVCVYVCCVCALCEYVYDVHVYLCVRLCVCLRACVGVRVFRESMRIHARTDIHHQTCVRTCTCTGELRHKLQDTWSSCNNAETCSDMSWIDLHPRGSTPLFRLFQSASQVFLTNTPPAPTASSVAAPQSPPQSAVALSAILLEISQEIHSELRRYPQAQRETDGESEGECAALNTRGHVGCRCAQHGRARRPCVCVCVSAAGACAGGCCFVGMADECGGGRGVSEFESDLWMSSCHFPEAPSLCCRWLLSCQEHAHAEVVFVCMYMCVCISVYVWI